MSRPFAALPLLFLSACPTSKPDVTDVSECAGSSDVDDTTAIVSDFEESAHEMVTCGNITFQLLVALIESAQTFMTDPDKLPSAFSYADGQYQASGTGVSMALWFVAGDASPVGASGDTLAYNLFDPDSFFVGMSLVDNGDGTATLSFDTPGPLAAMLGRGDAPESPLTVTDADAAVLSANLAALNLAGSIFVDNVQSVSTITYELENPARPVSEVLLGAEVTMSGIGTTGTRDDLGQSLTTTVWDVDYGQVHGTLDGSIELDVVGGPFDFHAVLDYSPITVDPVITVTCL